MKKRFGKAMALMLSVAMLLQTGAVNVLAAAPEGTEANASVSENATAPAATATEPKAEEVLTTEPAQASLGTEDEDPIKESGYFTVSEPTEEQRNRLYTEADPSETQVYNAMMAMRSQYPEGRAWTNNNGYVGKGLLYNSQYPGGVIMTGYGCVGFALILSDNAFGSAPMYQKDDYAGIRVGDILRVNNNSHSVIVLSDDGDYYTIAEGNYNSSIHWGRRIYKSSLPSIFNYRWTRYTGAKVDMRAIKAYVGRLYTNILGRGADDAGLNGWADAIATGQATGAQVAQGFLVSDELKNQNLNDEEYVTRLYRTFMDREPDAGGKAAWVKVLKQGYSRLYVAAGFVNSAEFTMICQGYGITKGEITASNVRDDINLYADRAPVEDYVDSLYRNFLGRPADAAGKKAWADAICAHQATAANVACDGFFHSPEYTMRNTSNEQFLRDLYSAFFRRQPDPEGFNGWLNALNQGYSREYVILHGFNNSAEFTAILRSYGLRCAD